MTSKTRRQPLSTRKGIFFGAAIFFVLILCFVVTDVTLTELARSVPKIRTAIAKMRGRFQTAPETKTRIPDPVLHHTLAPMISAQTEWWGGEAYALSTNSLGLKDATARNVETSSSALRVLFIGDSFTEGVGVPFEKTFVGILSERWKNRSAEVLNAGVMSYSPTVYFRKVKQILERGIDIAAVVVFIDISDPWDELLYREEADGGLSRADGEDNMSPWPKLNFLESTLIAHSTVFGPLLQTAYRARHGYPPNVGVGLKRARWTMDPQLQTQVREGVLQSIAAMQKLCDYLARRNIPLGVAVYPWPDQILERDSATAHTAVWEKWANENRVSYFSLFAKFLERDARETLKENFIPGDVHWNAHGHALVAKEIQPWILELLRKKPVALAHDRRRK